MPELIPIKIKIGLKEEGGAKYPDFNIMAFMQGKTTWVLVNTSGSEIVVPRGEGSATLNPNESLILTHEDGQLPGVLSLRDDGKISLVKKELDWSYYVDSVGPGWIYDKCCGHAEEDAESPLGQQWGVLMVPLGFADAALGAFPDTVSELNETEFNTFYEQRVASRLETEVADDRVMMRINAKKAAGLELSQEDLDAMDSSKDTPGLRLNPDKTADGFMQHRGIVIKQRAKFVR